MQLAAVGISRMLPDEQQILRILAESGQPMFASEITELLNAELTTGADYNAIEVINHLQSLYENVVQVADGRWTLKRLLR